MSYILDALRTADAKRGRDSLPGMHAPPARIVFAASRRESRPWVWVLAGMALVLLGWLVWWMPFGPTSRLAERPVALADNQIAAAAGVSIYEVFKVKLLMRAEST